MNYYETFELAKTLEKTNVNQAIKIYEEIINENFDGNYPYDRLIILYKKLKRKDDAIRVTRKAIYVFENIVLRDRVDRQTKLEKFKNQLYNLENNTAKIKHNGITSNNESDSNKKQIDTITVIDFETASCAFYSACALGIVVIKNHNIIDKKYFLIQPPDNFYEKPNIDIHGITPNQTVTAETFPSIWNKVKQLFENTYIAAHNANFDMSVLKATLNYYDIEQPYFYYFDTMSISGIGIPRGENVGRSLADRCSYYNIPLCDHHNALSDAEAAANLIIYQLNHSKYKKFETFVKYSICFSNYADIKLKKCNIAFSHRKIDLEELAATITVAEEKDDDFDGKTFVFTGELTKFTREQAMAKVIARGGSVKNGVSKKVDVLVHAENEITTKVKKAIELNEAGFPIKIVSEEQFMLMLESNDAIEI